MGKEHFKNKLKGRLKQAARVGIRTIGREAAVEKSG
jgi:hypothetical protein